MNNEISVRQRNLRNVFFILAVLDFIDLILVCFAMIPTFKDMLGYGLLMFIVSAVMVAVVVVILLFEILTKIFLTRKLSSVIDPSSGSNGRSIARILFVFNLGAVIIGVLAMGGEGATLLNQARLWLQVLVAAAEMIAVCFYLRMVKRLGVEQGKG